VAGAGEVKLSSNYPRLVVSRGVNSKITTKSPQFTFHLRRGFGIKI
jgi:hypothetical protein